MRSRTMDQVQVVRAYATRFMRDRAAASQEGAEWLHFDSVPPTAGPTIKPNLRVWFRSGHVWQNSNKIAEKRRSTPVRNSNDDCKIIQNVPECGT
jgi:hypothetical protein